MFLHPIPVNSKSSFFYITPFFCGHRATLAGCSSIPFHISTIVFFSLVCLQFFLYLFFLYLIFFPVFYFFLYLIFFWVLFFFCILFFPSFLYLIFSVYIFPRKFSLILINDLGEVYQWSPEEQQSPEIKKHTNFSSFFCPSLLFLFAGVLLRQRGH